MASSSVDFISLSKYSNHIYQGTERALQKTLDEIKEYLIITIQKIVYQSNATWFKYTSGMNGISDRQYTLLQSYAWDVKYWGRLKGYATYSLDFDDSFYSVHGVEPLRTVDDFISVLDENVSDLFTDSFHPEGWWTNFKAWVEASFDDLFTKNMIAEGIQVKRY